MVNNAVFSKRFQKICDEYELSAAAFAEKVQVGRATISHILSGRNKPSLDFVMKLTLNFPEVDLYWLLYGKGDFPRTDEKSKEEFKHLTTPPILNSIPETEKTKTETPTPPITKNPNTDVFEKNITEVANTQKIKRVVIFFEDGHFESYEG